VKTFTGDRKRAAATLRYLPALRAVLPSGSPPSGHAATFTGDRMRAAATLRYLPALRAVFAKWQPAKWARRVCGRRTSWSGKTFTGDRKRAAATLRYLPALRAVFAKWQPAKWARGVCGRMRGLDVSVCGRPSRTLRVGRTWRYAVRRLTMSLMVSADGPPIHGVRLATRVGGGRRRAFRQAGARRSDVA